EEIAKSAVEILNNMYERSITTGLKPSTLRNLAYRNEVPYYKQGKFIVFNLDELKEWLEDRTKKVK
ncbi:MAG TPA: helix-turn-helix domain-containing protein, partial [bacterium]|nr:helix-turn-helix domain-containing protein [bacterium]